MHGRKHRGLGPSSSREEWNEWLLAVTAGIEYLDPRGFHTFAQDPTMENFVKATVAPARS